jgi:hypothetical protein
MDCPNYIRAGRNHDVFAVLSFSGDIGGGLESNMDSKYSVPPLPYSTHRSRSREEKQNRQGAEEIQRRLVHEITILLVLLIMKSVDSNTRRR